MPVYDLVFIGCRLIDGTDSPAFAADIGIIDDQIAAIGDLDGEDAGRIIEVPGLTLAPGFIDIHTHSDVSVPFHPQQESMIAQGVTTQVVGNCSMSVGFATAEDLFAIERRWMRPHGVDITWSSFDEHLRHVEDLGVATNYAMLAGQGTLRKRVMGMEDRQPDPAELEQMSRLLRSAFEAGAWGISTGLEYTPSKYARVEELSTLSTLAAEFGGIYASHLRNEGDTLIEAVEEAIEVGERSGAAVQLSHHKAEGRANWGKVRTTLGIVDLARKRGLDVQLDQYPYTAFQTSLSVQTLPEWALRGTNETILARLSDADQCRLIKEDILAAHPDWDDLSPGCVWEGMVLGLCRVKREMQGRVIAELAREAGIHPVDFVLETILTERNLVSAVNFAICEEDIATVMQHPFTMIGSDAVGVAPRGKMAEDRVHPRSYGTFPRVLSRYVRELGVLTEEQAIHKMTGMPAARLGMADRGVLKTGNKADLVVYNAKTVSDQATFAEPHRLASGIEWVVVNGRIALEAGAANGNLAGKVLRKGK